MLQDAMDMLRGETQESDALVTEIKQETKEVRKKVEIEQTAVCATESGQSYFLKRSWFKW